jgi:hypothetical protein
MSSSARETISTLLAPSRSALRAIYSYIAAAYDDNFSSMAGKLFLSPACLRNSTP